jgi:hypothetical protein
MAEESQPETGLSGCTPYPQILGRLLALVKLRVGNLIYLKIL